jgi:phosphoribosylformylglycinamidine synthase
MAQFVGCLEGMAEACRALDFPIVSGNVSLYNESKATGGGSAILPTPAIGGVGLLDDWEKSATIGFKAEGEDILLVFGKLPSNLGQSLWLDQVLGRKAGPPPAVDLDAELRVGEFIRAQVRSGSVTAVHDVSDGGFLVAVAEMALASGIGAQIDFGEPKGLTDLAFGEAQACFVVTVPNATEFQRAMTNENSFGVDAICFGKTGGEAIKLLAQDDLGEVPLADLRAAHEGFFPKLMGNELTPEF